MQEIHFETIVKNGYIKIPEQYSGLDNKKVAVDILNRDTAVKEKMIKVKQVKEFLRKCSGILQHPHLPADITAKEIREMRLKEKAVQITACKEEHIDLILTRNKKDFKNDFIRIQTPQEFLNTAPGV